MPLLFRPSGIQIVVTPLNLLGKQNVASLDKAGIHAISISLETVTPANFQAISAFKYWVVVISPEQIMKPDGGFERLLKSPLFTQQIISIVINEAHCLTDWGEFQPEYKELSRLCAVHDHSETQYGMDTMVNANLNGTSDEESGDEDLLLISADALGASQGREDLVLLKALARGEDPLSRLAHAGKRRKVDLDMGTDFLINAEK
ncbi:hypothetical protein F5141DRAFT_1217225 [Pisolithus sp. B1]|nr:hypothetical protein F5141DRAFT_1217225 [Pisolithus sp. B1]